MKVGLTQCDADCSLEKIVIKDNFTISMYLN